MSEKMELVWDNHLANIGELFNTLYEDMLLVDVTLSCQGGFLRAHKLVLSACSTYFKQVFQENPCKHPTIVLRSVLYEDMSKLLEYMYRGCITVAPTRFDDIMRIATDLKIKGFDAYKEKAAAIKQDVEKDENESAPNTVIRDTRFKGQKRVNVGYVDETEEPKKQNLISTILMKSILNQNKSPEPQPTKETATAVPGQENCCASSSENEEEEEATDEKLNGRTDNDNKSKIVTLFECDVCTRRFKSRKDLQKHKKIHQDKSFSCEFCSKLFSRASHLIRHRRVHTGERPFICDTCGKDFARQDKLKLHVRTSHHILDDSGKDGSHVEINIGMVHNKDVIMDDEADSDGEIEEHITLEHLLPTSNSSNTSNGSCNKNKEKRGRGRPRKYPICDYLPSRRHRGRPRKEGFDGDKDYDITSLPYGDINYLTMPLEQSMAIEPLVEINTDTNMAAPEIKSFENGVKPHEKDQPESITIGKIGECTISLS